MLTKHLIPGSLACLALVMAASSCKKEDIAAEPMGTGGTNTGGTNTGGAGGVAGSGGVGGTLVSDQCPQGLAGPELVRLPAPDGSFYCMDERETTVAEYTAFMGEAKADPKTQPTECEWNDSFVPHTYNDEPDTPPNGCYYAAWDLLKANPGFAMACVDFCDAFAYCKWAGKRLCGKVGADGSKLLTTDYATGLGIVTSVDGEWHGACSQGGKTKFAYGDTRDPGKCVEVEKFKALGNASLDVTQSGASGCHGSSPPYSAVFDIDGSISEWQNVCDANNCVAAGTDYSDETPKGCEEHGFVNRRSEGPSIGIRCCADAVAAK